MDMMTNSEAGMMYVEHDDVEAARLALDRSLGQPEHELYHDESPTLYYKDEKGLNTVVDLQERMAVGMLMINEQTAKLEWYKDGHQVPYDTYMDTVVYRSKLWSHWWLLKGKCDKLAEAEVSIWLEYFKLASEDITVWNTYGRSDNQEEGDNRMIDTVDAYKLADQEEQLLLCK